MKTITVRLEGGIGNHLLGMRLLKYIHMCYQEHRIVAYSDAGNSVLPLEVAALSPYVSEVRSLEKDPMRVSGSMGSLAELTAESLTNLKSGEHFFDTHTELLFLEECRRLNLPHFEVLASRPELAIPPDAVAEARAFLRSLPGMRYVAINFMKYGPSAIRSHLDLIKTFLSQILHDSEFGVLHFCMTGDGRPRHAGSSHNSQRPPGTLETEELDSLAECYPGRVFPVMDKRIVDVCALLQECSYFVGVGNDLKHLAWALDVPRTWLGPKLWADAIFRWAPDYNCMLELKPFSNMEETGRLLASRVKDALYQKAAMPPGEADPYVSVAAN